MEGYSLKEALEYVEFYPEYVELCNTIRELKKWLILVGDFSQLARIEKYLCSASPWNYKEIENKIASVNLTYKDLILPRDGDGSGARSIIGEEFFTALERAIEHGNQTAIETYAYGLAHRSGRMGRCLFGPDEEIGSELRAFLMQHKSELSKNTLMLLLLDGTPDEIFERSALREYESMCPEVHDLYLMGVILGKTELNDDSLTEDIIDRSDIKYEAFVQLADHVEESSFSKFCVGYCYHKGICVEQDLDKANHWLKCAASEGCYNAQIMMCK